MASGSRNVVSSRSPFVGREKERAALSERLESAGQSEGGVVLISGEPGIGKTRLLGEFAEEARVAGWLVLSGRAYDTAGMPPYLPVVEALEQHASLWTPDELQELLDGIAAVAALVPGLEPYAVPPTPLPPDAERLRLFEAITQYLLRVAEAPSSAGLLLVLDDLQWADPSTLQLLTHARRKLAGSRLLIVAAYRSDAAADAGAPLAQALAGLSREQVGERVALGPLPREATAALVAAVAGVEPSGAVVNAVQEWTQGNPFFIEEVVRQLRLEGRDLTQAGPSFGAWPVPQSLREVIEQRLSRLEQEALRVLQAAAVIGDGFTVRLLRRVCELADEALVAALEALTRASLLREDGAGYAFSHPLMRDAVYNGTSLARRQLLHGRAAASAGADSALAAIGHHWRQAGYPDRAVDPLLRAGDAAVALTAWSEAASCWLAGLECMEEAGYPARRRARLLEGLGDLYFVSTFEAGRAVGYFEQAIGLYEVEGEVDAAARVHLKAGRCLAYPTTGFDAPGALDHLRAANEVFSVGAETFEVGELYFARGHMETHTLRSSPEELVRAMGQLEAIAERLDSPFLQVAATSMQGHFLALQGRLREGLALEAQACEQAAALAVSAPELWPAGWRDMLQVSGSEAGGNGLGSAGLARYFGGYLRPFTLNCCGLQSLDLADPTAAKVMHERLRDAQGRLTSPLLVWDLFLAGELGTLRQLREGSDTLLSPLTPIGTAVELMVDWSNGRWDNAAAGLEKGAATFRSYGSDSISMLHERWFARLCRTTGRARESAATLEAMLEKMVASGSVKFEVPLRAELALVLLETGRSEEAERHLERCREVLAKGEDWRGIAGRVALAEAVLAAARRRHEDAEGYFERAVEVFRALTLPWDEAEAFEVWAQAGARHLRGRNRRAFMGEKLAAARAVYERIGAGVPWLQRLDGMAGRLLDTGSPERETYPAGLTQREVEVLRLLAGGASNREIADALVLSLRTVERHITNIYAKIGARGKADATAFALHNSLN